MIGPLAFWGFLLSVLVAIKVIRWRTSREIEKYGQIWEGRVPAKDPRELN